jgi:hypothetical protein
MKLESLTASPNYPKKLKAVFRLDNGRTKTIHFGDRRYGDYTQHNDKVRRERYLERHVAREDWTKPASAGTLSAFILWGKSTNLIKNVITYMKTFNL